MEEEQFCKIAGSVMTCYSLFLKVRPEEVGTHYRRRSEDIPWEHILYCPRKMNRKINVGVKVIFNKIYTY